MESNLEILEKNPGLANLLVGFFLQACYLLHVHKKTAELSVTTIDRTELKALQEGVNTEIMTQPSTEY